MDAVLQRLREPIDTPTAIGIGVVIGSNVVISLALNFQKLAHRRLNLDQSASGSASGSGASSSRKSSATPPAARPQRPRSRASSNASYGAQAGSPTRYLPSTAVILETEPLLQRPPLRKAVSGLPTVEGGSSDSDDKRQPAQGVAAILPRPRASSLQSGSRKLVPKVKLAPRTPTTPTVELPAVGILAAEVPIAADSSSSSRSQASSRREARDSSTLR